jgi:prenyltransferase beta subunit
MAGTQVADEPVVGDVLAHYLTSDGGASQREADLWCTYAAVRALRWLGTMPRDASGAVDFVLARQNPDGGFAWQHGLQADAWATYYCSQVLLDLDRTVPRVEALARWLESTRAPDGGHSMTPGQAADVWSTYYATRTLSTVLGHNVADPPLRSWLSQIQTDEGGLGWAPGWQRADARACYYGVNAWHCAGGPAGGPPWDVPRLISWLRSCQNADGGAGFRPGQPSCLWATFRIVGALGKLAAGLGNADACVRWVLDRALLDGGFERWEGYGSSDVWACFAAVGTLQALNTELPAKERLRTVTFLQECQLPTSGFTYREPERAGDALATAAVLIASALTGGPSRNSLARWLNAAHLPYEGGLMYMPARGAEVRCTLWATAALAFAGVPQLSAARIASWLTRSQNPDGGFGYWEGRGSDIVSTASALECLSLLQHPLEAAVRLDALLEFLAACEDSDGMRPSPRGTPTVASTCQGVRLLLLLGQRERADRLVPLVLAHASRSGGFSARLGGPPDLLSTYQAALTFQRLGQPLDRVGLARFLRALVRPRGHAWSPLAAVEGGPLAHCLGLLLTGFYSEGGALPPLNL